MRGQEVGRFLQYRHCGWDSPNGGSFFFSSMVIGRKKRWFADGFDWLVEVVFAPGV